MKKLNQTEQSSFAQFFPVILNMLTIVICTKSGAIAREAFESLVIALERVTKLPNQPNPNYLINFYIQYVFENPIIDVTTPPYHAFTIQFAETLQGQVCKIILN